jgi:alkylation response protein AidB-like acyl-CoA dehydrogenase
MQFDLSDEQALLRDTLRQYLARRYDFVERVAASRCDPGFREDVWRDFAKELGLLGVIAPVELGGLGGGAAEQLVVMEELGRALCLEPVAETIFQAGWLLRHGRGPARTLLERIIAGDAIVAVAVGEPQMRFDFEDIAATASPDGDGWVLRGRKSMAVAAPWADALIVAARTGGKPGDRAGLSLFLVPADADGLTLHGYPTIDGRRAADIEIARVRVTADRLIGRADSAADLMEELRDRAIAAQAAEAAGLLERLVTDTVAYAKQRQQFGQPIAKFQVLQHRMVDMYIQVELTRAAALFAAAKLEGDPLVRAKAASSAKIAVARACRFVGQNAVQLHGGMGMTDELPVGHYFKRATQLETEWGSEGWHVARRNRLESMA